MINYFLLILEANKNPRFSIMKLTEIRRFLPILFLVLVAACGTTTTETASVELNCEADGPFFEGVNSLMTNYEVKLSDIITKEGIDASMLKEVKLKGAKFVLNDEYLADGGITSATLQIVSDQTEMKSIAVKNPLALVDGAFTLGVSEEADMSDYFKENMFTLVLDVDLVEDSYNESLSSSVSLELELTYKE